MNDSDIREVLHKKFFIEEHNDKNTLVINELGLLHGKCRADIAVINGHLNGFEIKSDNDSLYRLENQIYFYNTVFENISIVLTEKHLQKVIDMLPDWWGIILIDESISLNILKGPSINNYTDDYSVAQLLWRREVIEILKDLGITDGRLRGKRSILYQFLIDNLNSEDLKFIVRTTLKNRKEWRNF